MFRALEKENLRTILFALLFCGTPLVFSHLCVLFGIDFHPFSSGYERYKVYYIIMLVLALIPLSLFDGEKIKTIIPAAKYMPFLLIGFTWGLVWFGVEHHTLSEILFGSSEKQHGLFFFMALAALFFILQKTKDAWRHIARWSLFTGVLLSIYALLQYTWLDPLAGWYYHDGWNTNRVFSTLGNPNYLAGYLLLLLPIVWVQAWWQRIILWALFSIVILLTGSVFGIILLGFYFLWKIIYRWKRNQRILMVWFIGACMVCISYLFLPPEKMYSFLARFALWRDGLDILLHNPVVLLFGNGPDTIISYLQNHNIIQSGAYFSPGSVIDSFHNLFLDSIFFFGLPANLLLYTMIARRWKYLHGESQEWILLFVLFFSMNIVISVHLLLFVFFTLSQKHESREEVHEKDVRIFDN